MGIKHLYQLIDEHAPESIKKGEIKNQFGRKVAIVGQNTRLLSERPLIHIGCVRSNRFP